MESEVLNASFDPSPATNVDNHVETNHELVPSTHEVIKDGTAPDSRALVAVPAVSVEALAVVPVNQKTRRCELVQRRTRRPFSVSEVEALVEAVEKLGTGRCANIRIVIICLLFIPFHPHPRSLFQFLIKYRILQVARC